MLGSDGRPQRTVLACFARNVMAPNERKDELRRAAGKRDHTPPEVGSKVTLDHVGVVLQARVHLTAIAPRSAPARLFGLQ